MRAVKADVPELLAGIVGRCLRKDPDQRYQSGEQMAKAIRLCLGTLTAAPKPAAVS